MATIIKHETQEMLSGTPLRKKAYDLSDLAGQADVYLTSVRAEAAKIIQEAKQETVRIRQQAEQAGRKAAEEAVEQVLDEKVARQMQSLIPALESAVEQLVDSKQQWLQHWENRAVALACAIAERIIRSELRGRPELSLEWVADALRLASGASEIVIQLNPHDFQTMRTQVKELAKVLSPVAKARVVSNEEITLGGCRIETEFGSIDYQLETQLERMAEELC